MTATHTYVVLEVSKRAFEEIKKKLKEAGYQHTFHDGLIDMHGIAIQIDRKEPKKKSVQKRKPKEKEVRRIDEERSQKKP
jgi:hypothetical protein